MQKSLSHLYTCTHTRTHTLTHTHTHTHTHKHTHTHTHTHNTHTHTHARTHADTNSDGIMHTKSVHKSYLKGRDENRQEQKRFFSKTTTYLKATKKGGIKITKDTFINISKIVLS